MLDFSKLFQSNTTKQIEPRDIFMTLPVRGKQYEYPRDVQSEVWKKWYDIRDNKNNIIKMNTGSGKTVVGLIILKSCLNEEKGPAVYVVPDSFLVNQVCAEARRLGISVCTDEEDMDFLIKKSILVINIQKLINGKSVFGMRQFGNVNIGSIIIDDIHACLASIESQFTITIPKDNELYRAIRDKFISSMKEQSTSKCSDIIDMEDPYTYMLIPFWDWQAKCNEIHTLFSQNIVSPHLMFSFPLLKDCLSLCNCMISARRIEITPKCIPIHHITSFINADRRIFMSATLADDSAFVSALDIDSDEIKSVISPEKANDIGDRLLIFPQVINKNIQDAEIKTKLTEFAQNHNVVVIVPTKYRAKFWEDSANLILDTSNLDTGIERLKSGHIGLTVLINKYDGIDLPEDACRILVIDGMPRLWSDFDSFEQNALPKSRRLCSEQIQKIEQGIGRGVRSNTDYCVVVLMGKGLADVVYGSDGYHYFSEATKKQFEISNRIWESLKDRNLDEIMNIAYYCLSRDPGWVELSRQMMATIPYNTDTRINSVIITLRKAFNLAESGRYLDAATALTEEKNNTKNIELRGLLKQYIAEMTNFVNPEQAQQIVLSANTDNRALLKPIQGIQFDRIVNRTQAQAVNLFNYINEQQLLPNSYVLKINALLDCLVFAPDTANQFENALKEVSFLIGIYSTRPENDYGKGPDNFWDIGNSTFLIIECKNGTITQSISKHDCNQLNGSINWFDNLYRDISFTGFPIMIHNSDVFEYACSPNEKIRIMTPQLLERFRDNIHRFAISIAQPGVFNNQVEINSLLMQYKLMGRDIVNNYTKDFRTT